MMDYFNEPPDDYEEVMSDEELDEESALTEDDSEEGLDVW